MDKKKRAAAISAVMNYIKSEEEIISAQCFSSQRANALTLIKPWGQSARQTQMQMRNMMQMKQFHRTTTR